MPFSLHHATCNAFKKGSPLNAIFLGLANIHSCALLRLKKFVSFSKVHLATSFFNGKVGIFFLGRKKKCLSLVCCAYTVIDFRVCRLDGAKGSNKISFEVLGGKRRLLNPHGGLQAQSSVQSCTQKTKSNPFNHHNFWGPQNGAGLSTRDKNWGCFYLLSKATLFFFSPIQYFHYASKTYHEKKAVWEEALENYRSSLLCLHYYCRLLAKHYFFSFHNARPTVEEKTHSFLTSTYNCKSRNLLFDFSFHYVFNLHFVGLIYIFFCLDVYIWGCDGFTVTSQWIS